MAERLDGPAGACSHALGALGWCTFAAAPSLVTPEELAHARGLPQGRAPRWLAGRAALRQALGLYPEVQPANLIGASARGAPDVGAGWTASLSHKGELAVAVVGPAKAGLLGADLEFAVGPRLDIGRRILQAPELAQLMGQEPQARRAALAVRFALKEALYKAIDPVLQRFVGFREVALEPTATTAALTLDGHRFTLDLQWQSHGPWLLALVRAARDVPSGKLG